MDGMWLSPYKMGFLPYTYFVFLKLPCNFQVDRVPSISLKQQQQQQNVRRIQYNKILLNTMEPDGWTVDQISFQLK